MFGADLFLMPFMEFQVRTVTKLSGIKKIMEDLFIRFFKQGLFALDTRGPYKCWAFVGCSIAMEVLSRLILCCCDPFRTSMATTFFSGIINDFLFFLS